MARAMDCFELQQAAAQQRTPQQMRKQSTHRLRLAFRLRMSAICASSHFVASLALFFGCRATSSSVHAKDLSLTAPLQLGQLQHHKTSSIREYDQRWTLCRA
jgi:hypothetical protein